MRKSPCCGAKIRRFGRRRRQCRACLKTWSIRPKKRGRPSLRSDKRLIDRVLVARRSLTELARHRKLSRQALSHRFLTELTRQSKIARSVTLGDGGCILIVDGLWFKFKRRPWVAYLMALRPVHSNRATFVSPVIREGRESASGWQAALETIPADVRNGVRAFVVDDFTGCTTLARENKWILQLCHFHMLARLRARAGFRRPGGVSLALLRQQAYELVSQALTSHDSERVLEIRSLLQERYIRSQLPWKYRNMLRQFTKRIDEYRAYRLHPQLLLPRTTGTVESMNRILRDLLRRTRSLSTPRAVQLWLENYLRLRPTITCNPANLSTD